MSMSEVVGAPAPVRIGEKELSASPVSLYDLGMIEESAKAAYLRIASQGYEGLTPVIRRETMDAATDRAMMLTFDSPQVQQFMKSPRGACQLISTSLKPMHPEMTPQAVAIALVGKLDQIGPIVETIARISGFSVEGGGDGSHKFPSFGASPAVVQGGENSL